jgi:hypothetical protein
VRSSPAPCSSLGEEDAARSPPYDGRLVLCALLLLTVGEGKAEGGGRQRRDWSEVQAQPLHAPRCRI